MNIVIVKHNGCGQYFLFIVPEGRTLKAGDIVMVATKTGRTTATCLCDSFIVEDKSNMDLIARSFNIAPPTKYVVGRYEYEEWIKEEEKIDE